MREPEWSCFLEGLTVWQRWKRVGSRGAVVYMQCPFHNTYGTHRATPPHTKQATKTTSAHAAVASPCCATTEGAGVLPLHRTFSAKTNVFEPKLLPGQLVGQACPLRISGEGLWGGSKPLRGPSGPPGPLWGDSGPALRCSPDSLKGFSGLPCRTMAMDLDSRAFLYPRIGS